MNKNAIDSVLFAKPQWEVDALFAHLGEGRNIAEEWGAHGR
jgi:hypothetical protein